MVGRRTMSTKHYYSSFVHYQVATHARCFSRNKKGKMEQANASGREQEYLYFGCGRVELRHINKAVGRAVGVY